jgi:hypothetical protein
MFDPFWKGVVFLLGGVLMLFWSYGWMPSRGDEPPPPRPTSMKVIGWFQLLIGVFYLFIVRG